MKQSFCKFAVLTALALLCTGVQAQKTSQNIVDAINARKFSMKLSGETQTPQGQMAAVSLEMALMSETSLLRISMTGFESVTLVADRNCFLLDEWNKTYRHVSGDVPPIPNSKLVFNRYGKCRLNGQLYLFDEYCSDDGTALCCYYNSDKISAVELTVRGRNVGPLPLLSFTSAIPSNMFFCLSPDWKSAASSSVMPPVCDTPWQDFEMPVELACGKETGRIVITEKVELKSED